MATPQEKEAAREKMEKAMADLCAYQDSGVDSQDLHQVLSDNLFQATDEFLAMVKA